MKKLKKLCANIKNTNPDLSYYSINSAECMSKIYTFYGGDTNGIVKKRANKKRPKLRHSVYLSAFFCKHGKRSSIIL